MNLSTSIQHIVAVSKLEVCLLNHQLLNSYKLFSFEGTVRFLLLSKLEPVEIGKVLFPISI